MTKLRSNKVAMEADFFEENEEPLEDDPVLEESENRIFQTVYGRSGVFL